MASQVSDSQRPGSCHVPIMARHSIRQRQRDELAFPVRVKFDVPAMDMNRVLKWFKAELPEGDFSCQSSTGTGCDTLAFYFRDTDAANRFVAAHPQFELADGTLSSHY